MSKYFIEDWHPSGHRVMVTAPEGSYKTILNCYLALCVATGRPYLGQTVEQGSVVMVDEETPWSTLDDKLTRFALSFDVDDWRRLPLTVLSMTGFRFSRKTELDKLLRVVDAKRPKLVSLDSILAMIPGHRQGMVENDSGLGIAIRDDLISLLDYSENITICAHAKKSIADLSFKQLKGMEMQSIVRGSGAIVGEACDTGIVISKISEYPDPTRLVLTTKARRMAVPMTSSDVYIELTEETYGKGWLNMECIEPVVLPPSTVAKAIFSFFKDGNVVIAKEITQTATLYSRSECRAGIEELLDRRAILNGSKPFTYRVNPNIQKELASHYVEALYKKLR